MGSDVLEIFYVITIEIGEGKRCGHKWGPSSVPTILICIKNNNYKLNKQNSCNLIIILFFWFFILSHNKFIQKIELEHTNRLSSTVLTQKSSPVRFMEDVNCETHHLKGKQPQLIPKKNTEYKSYREPSIENAQHNTHTHETEKLRVSRKPAKLNLGKKIFFFSFRARSRQNVW